MTNTMTHKEIPLILIVDDIETNRFTLRDIITEIGYKPILTENGEQALKVVERFPIHLIILDIAMPVMDGFEVCKILKSNPETKEIPIIFISAFDDASDIERGFALEGEDYITKPFTPSIVKARVKLHLKLYETNLRLKDLNRQLHISVDTQLKQMEIEKKNVLYALLRIARESACYDTEHMERLSYNCRTLAEAMQLSSQYDHLISDTYVDTIELAAPLCDLGNVAISTTILQKTDALTEEETEIIRTHTTIGAKILKDIQSLGDYNDFIQMSIDIAGYHHENWDGSGYPSGISGDEIPLAAQIVAVVSVYCALTENRIYREMYGASEALQIMEQDSGIKFNPVIFEILKKIFRQLH